MSQLFSPAQIQLFPECVQARVDETIAPNQPGRVYCQGSYWPAKLYRPECQVILHPAQAVLAVGLEGITLLIVPQ